MLWGTVNNTIRSMVCRSPPILKNQHVYTQLVTEAIAFAVALKNHLRGEKTRPEELGAMLPYALIVSLGESVNPPLAAVHAYPDATALLAPTSLSPMLARHPVSGVASETPFAPRWFLTSLRGLRPLGLSSSGRSMK